MTTNLMRLKIAFVMLTLSNFAQAHPQQTDSLDNVGVGSTLLVTENINIKPNKQDIRFSDRVVTNATESYYMCELRIKDKSAADRILKKGKVLVISEVIENIGAYLKSEGRHTRYTILKFSNQPNIAFMYCSQQIYVHELRGRMPFEISIGETTQVLHPFFQLKFAEPTEL